MDLETLSFHGNPKLLFKQVCAVLSADGRQVHKEPPDLSRDFKRPPTGHKKIRQKSCKKRNKIVVTYMMF